MRLSFVAEVQRLRRYKRGGQFRVYNGLRTPTRVLSSRTFGQFTVYP
jgi:hypothetical protein